MVITGCLLRRSIVQKVPLRWSIDKQFSAFIINVCFQDDESLESAEGRIKFDKIFVNLGNGFNLTTSEFKASVKGVYYFSFNVGKFPEKILSVIMMKNVNEVQVKTK